VGGWFVLRADQDDLEKRKISCLFWESKYKRFFVVRPVTGSSLYRNAAYITSQMKLPISVYGILVNNGESQESVRYCVLVIAEKSLRTSKSPAE
jgi:hypothetical protein